MKPAPLLDAQNAGTLIAQQDLVLDGCDNFSTRYLVNQYCRQLNVPLLSASAIGFQGQMFMVEGDSACYECLFPKEQHVNESCAVPTVAYWQPHRMLWLLYKRIMPYCTWV